jgi:DNA invertase Pin-like site-specific DNA recombinase
MPDARDIVDEFIARGVLLNAGGSIHDLTEPIGRLLFTVLSMIAEFEADLARARTRRHGGGEGQGPAARRAAQAQPEAGGPPGRVVARWQHTTFELAELYNVARSTVYRAIQHGDPPADPAPAAADPAT